MVAMQQSSAASSSSTAMEDDDYEPPLMATYKHLLDSHPHRLDVVDHRSDAADADEEECFLPVIDLSSLLLQHQHKQSSGAEAAAAEQCRASIEQAAAEWGFFQVTNHGVPQALLDELHQAQVAVFRRPFHLKACQPLLDFSPESYRWGTPTATCLEQLSWSEAYHIPTTNTTAPAATAGDDDDKTRLVVEEVSTAMSKLAQQLAEILVADLGDSIGEDTAVVSRSTCFLRLNRYPPCAAPSGAYGLCPHTDSDFLTILHQDGVGGLQLVKAGRWVAVKPNPGALIVNVGDLLHAWSNDRYRSVEHRVMASAARERFSVAFFLCPSYDTLIRPRCGAGGPPRYESFTFGEYRNQIREDVRLTGRKLGLQRFRKPE
ncbi:gibberellin 2-beta-dioxygenase 5-like [Miscanthus floridulus]|uniref:gibberellin 2-beta-dioxygenase 5-like n=1 Tax=Miscanthus floridulus TaxID=154761 RepID=UPI0034585CC7